MERIRQRIGRIREHLALVRSLKGDCSARFSSDRIYRGALLHYLYLLADSCIVLAELVIKHRKLRLPQSYAEAFDILGDGGVIPSDFAYRFAAIAGFRNFLAHDYEKVDEKVICEDVMARLDDVDRYLDYIVAAVQLEG